MTLSYCEFLWNRRAEDPGIIYLFSNDGGPLGYVEQDFLRDWALLGTNDEEGAQ